MSKPILFQIFLGTIIFFFFGASSALLGKEGFSHSFFQGQFVKVGKTLGESVVEISPIPPKIKKKKQETFRERWHRLQKKRMLGISKGQIGSGVVLDKKGHILTSLSLLPKDATTINVTFLHGKKFQASVLKRYPKGGFALLKLPTSYGKPIPLGLSKPLKLGCFTLTLASSYASLSRVHQLSLAFGQISGIYELEDQYYKGMVLETDGAVGYGSYGGPLVLPDGKMVGLIIPSYSKIRWLGVAVPIDKILSMIGWSHLKGLSSSKIGSYKEVEKNDQTAFLLAKPNVISLDFSYPKSEISNGSYYKRPRVPCSGVIVGKKYVVTSSFNLRKIKNKIYIVTSSKKRYLAKKIAQDPNLDLTLLKVEKADWPAPSWANSKSTFLGEWLAVIGRPWIDPKKGGLSYTLNMGILSSKHRFRNQIYQTDSPVNFGNLGGAVVTMEGKLLGVVVRKSGKTGNSSGVGFFVPAHILKKSLDTLKKGKNIPLFQKSFLGIKMDSFSNQISKVFSKSPAHKAGVKENDFLLEVNGIKINHKFDLIKFMESALPGKKVILKVERDSQKLTLQMVLSNKNPKKR